jgi:uncharacterized protein YjbI with pentapeptide repeats
LTAPSFLTAINAVRITIISDLQVASSLKDALFNQVNASQALFMEADLTEAECKGSLFDQAILVGAVLERADFSGSRFFQSILQQTRASQALFMRCDLTYSDFSGADLRGADFRAATFSRTRMHRARQENAQFSGRRGILEFDEELLAAEAWSAQRQSRS